MLTIEVIGAIVSYMCLGTFVVGVVDHEPIEEDDIVLLLIIAVAWPLYLTHEVGRWLRTRQQLPKAKVVK